VCLLQTGLWVVDLIAVCKNGTVFGSKTSSALMSTMSTAVVGKGDELIEGFAERACVHFEVLHHMQTTTCMCMVVSVLSR